ncbi:hypothetical protein C8024_06050 [Sphingopyxis sp. BSNA05]|nr:hypothetical protein [Sphingopyxis sp. BSNA05]
MASGPGRSDRPSLRDCPGFRDHRPDRNREYIRRHPSGKNLERQQINGMLTAISQIEDLQLGDIVRLSYTVTSANEALAGRVQASSGFASEDVKVDFVRQRVRWPNKMDVKWRGSKAEIEPVKTSEGAGPIWKSTIGPANRMSKFRKMHPCDSGIAICSRLPALRRGRTSRGSTRPSIPATTAS